MDEQKLIEKILDRDRTALLVFYRTYTPKLVRFISTKVNDHQDVEEILQDTLLAFLEAIRDFQGKSTLSRFLYSICHHKIVDFYRRKKIKHVVFSRMPELEVLVSPLLNPEEELDVTLLKEKIHHVLGKLLPQYRRILTLKYVENLSVEDISKSLSITFKSAESKIFRARKAFVEAFISL